MVGCLDSRDWARGFAVKSRAREQAERVFVDLPQQWVQFSAVGGLDQLGRHALGRRRPQSGELVVDISGSPRTSKPKARQARAASVA